MLENSEGIKKRGGGGGGGKRKRGGVGSGGKETPSIICEDELEANDIIVSEPQMQATQMMLLEEDG